MREGEEGKSVEVGRVYEALWSGAWNTGLSDTPRVRASEVRRCMPLSPVSLQSG